ncbi:uncharacterized protein LOC126738729 [Anthonomus grandis grandis]|uniref:uncharacterized protein LOC126738729 n=1 Tax=Anthonomus grandis grandis TaxID=2921223 RepID=UPI0021661BBA|nr:uncharacterized protein LOC126738729 [Anthonomus grandis grandis]
MENIYKIVIMESGPGRLFVHPKSSRDLSQDLVARRKRSKKCLFGKADPEDTRRMLEEQYALDQERFMTRFGFDVETIEELERSKDDVKENVAEKKKCPGRKILKARRKMTFGRVQPNQGQQFITDFYQARKSSSALVLEKKINGVQDENVAPLIEDQQL